MGSVFVEVIMASKDLIACGITARDQIDDPLNDALGDAGVGEVSGGGGGKEAVILDVEVFDENRFAEALAIIRRVLLEVGAPATTVIQRYAPVKEQYGIQDPSGPS
jgi:hypothetical protein